MNSRTVELDVRPYLKKKLDPLQIIMDKVKTLGEQDTLVLHTTFKPAPLFMLMKWKGYAHETEKRNPEHWVSTFRKKRGGTRKNTAAQTEAVFEADLDSEVQEDSSEAPAGSSSFLRIELDNRGLEPPEPMVRTLHALEKCAPGDEVVIHNDRVPVLLIEELNSWGCTYSLQEQPDGSAKVTIRKP